MFYHFGISALQTNLPDIFGEIKFVGTGGSAKRMASYARQFSELANVPMSENLCKSDRYVMYKTGPVLWVNHGMGVPSLSIMLIELFQLLAHAGATNFEVIRMGTSGGVGIEPGTVVISSGAINGALEQKHFQWINGKLVKREAKLDQRMSKELFETAIELGLPAERGNTLCADDFYEGQMRLDGYFLEYGKQEKMEFLNRLQQLGVKNIEMEATGFAALTNRANILGAICCVALLNRMEGDTCVLDKSVYAEFEERPFAVVTNYMMKKMNGVRGQNGGYKENGVAEMKQNGIENGKNKN